MKVTEIKPGTNVSLPETAEDWELYATEKRTEAARSLSTALHKAVRELQRQAMKGKNPASSLDLVRVKHLHPVMRKYADVGASDTETRSIGFDALARVVDALRV